MTEAAPIHQLLGALVAAWNAGDATGYADLFAQDADYITFFGQNMAGRAAIEAGHRALFEGPLKGSRLSWGETPPKIRFLRPDVAAIMAGGHPSGDVTQASVITLTAVRDGGRWRFASFQNTRVAAVPGAPS
ncbi:SgcJ/EcaC family oxidoreductase [Actinomadura rupiterrae]|uniref:SgcJ/EcaC family oxidoreductase n=1 Tax=Actinomadura rupiterrae TaxID=559627 RepID=UPI0020A4CDEF|nr:SgcJ/EcaC family oxidoreductase [Actinomadura rupiterrae]MCP2335196.1 uncharacterized protein (TIGR02246 family) [Actinomadura rupiterrae]